MALKYLPENMAQRRIHKCALAVLFDLFDAFGEERQHEGS